MAVPGNEVHRISTVSSRSRPLKSSPLAGPAVLSGSISLNDNHHDINNDKASLSPSSLATSPSALLQLPIRPKSVHHPLSTLRSRSRSAQSLTRPVSWYAYPTEGAVGIVATSVGGDGNAEATGSLHGRQSRNDTYSNPRPNVNGNAKVNPYYRKRPSTAPGPSSSSSSSEDNEERSSILVRGTRLAGIGNTLAPQAPSRTHPTTPQATNSQALYSSSVAFATSAAGSSITISINDGRDGPAAAPAAGGSGARPTSILIDPDVPQPRPILKHRTSFVVPPSLSPTASSSRTSFLSSSNSDEFGGVGRSRSRLSVVSNASANPTGAHLSPHQHQHHPTYIKNIDASETNKESWYTFSPYANTPKFSRLGLASAGVVMPVSKKEAVKVRERRLSVVSSTSSNGKGLERTNTGASTRSRMSNSANRKSSDLARDRASMSSTREEEEKEEQLDRRPPPLPLPSTSPAPWLNVPATPTQSSPAHSSSSSSARTGTSTSPTGSCRSSPASSVASLHVVGETGDRANPVCGPGGEGANDDDEASRDHGGKELQPEGGKIEDVPTNVSSTTTTPTRKPKDKRKSLSISGSLKSWRSLRSNRRSGHDVPDMPAPPMDNEQRVVADTSQAKEPCGEDSLVKRDVAGLPSAPETTERGSESPLPQHEPIAGTMIDQPVLPSDSTEPATLSAPVAKLKKRKSASALLARVKSWRWRKEGPVGGGVDGGVGVMKKESDGKAGSNAVGVVEVEDVSAVADDENIVATNDLADIPSVDITTVEKVSEIQKPVVDIDNETTEAVPVEEVDLGVEGKEMLEEEDEEGSADSPYPGSTPSTTHSIPSFVPMSLMIPSPNLHVADGQVPAFIEDKLAMDEAEEDGEKSVLIQVIPCTPIDNDDEYGEEEEEETCVQDPEVVTVTVTVTADVPSLGETPQLQQAPVVPADNLFLNASDLSIEVDDPGNQISSDTVPPHPSPVPNFPEVALTAAPQITPTPPSDASSRPSLPIPPSIHPGRSLTKGRSKGRGRSSSVRRAWNAFICGGADAEQMAVAEAWAEIQADRGRPKELMYHDKGEEDVKVETVEVVVVAVERDSTATPLNRPSFSEIGKAL